MPKYPIAFCPVHGIFEAVGTVAIDNSMVTITGSITSCPKCGRDAEILPGTYDTTGRKLDFLVDPSISTDALSALKRIVERLQRNEISPEAAKAEAVVITPKAGSLFDIADWSDTAKATLYGAIIGAVAMVAAAKLAAPSASARQPQIVVERIIERQSERLQESTALPYIPMPSPRPK